MNTQLVIVLVASSWLISGISLIYALKLKRKISSLLEATKKQNLESYLEAVIADNNSTSNKLRQIEQIYSEVREISQKSLQKTSLVRFNPFKDTGGDQSFVVCMLDHKETGFIITAIHSREGTRIYTKDVINGASRLSLSHEEKQALAKALKN